MLGGGVAGASIAYYLTEKGFDVTIVEKNSRVGGLARTCYYAGHPYEFGPHIWFWPGGPDAPINSTIARLIKLRLVTAATNSGGNFEIALPTATATAIFPINDWCRRQLESRTPVSFGYIFFTGRGHDRVAKTVTACNAFCQISIQQSGHFGRRAVAWRWTKLAKSFRKTTVCFLVRLQCTCYLAHRGDRVVGAGPVRLPAPPGIAHSRARGGAHRPVAPWCDPH